MANDSSASPSTKGIAQPLVLCNHWRHDSSLLAKTPSVRTKRRNTKYAQPTYDSSSFHKRESGAANHSKPQHKLYANDQQSTRRCNKAHRDDNLKFLECTSLSLFLEILKVRIT